MLWCVTTISRFGREEKRSRKIRKRRGKGEEIVNMDTSHWVWRLDLEFKRPSWFLVFIPVPLYLRYLPFPVFSHRPPLSSSIALFLLFISHAHVLRPAMGCKAFQSPSQTAPCTPPKAWVGGGGRCNLPKVSPNSTPNPNVWITGLGWERLPSTLTTLPFWEQRARTSRNLTEDSAVSF